MIKILLWFVTISALLYSSVLNTDDPFKRIEYFKLENGLQVYLLNDLKAEKTQILVNVKVGYDVENENNYGLTHLVEHMVFRDQRVPFHDYLDYIKEEGGTDVNGYTKRYKTGYLATIDSNKSYWIVETFANMLFDKNVTKEDMRVEKGALQTEIGEPHWYNRPLWYLKTFLKNIVPKRDNIYRDDFFLKKPKDIPANYFAQENNQKFTYDEIIKHYNRYYYPANMILIVAGNFSLDKMKNLIEKKYGTIKKNGTFTTKKPVENPQLNHKAYKRFYEGVGNNRGYIGTKYLLDNYKKYLILNVYTINLAERLQQEMRNKHGKTYSVNSYMFNNQKAGVASITFDALHDDFEKNIKTVKKMMADDLKSITNTQIHKALKSYEKKYYTSVEHDSKTLMELIDMQRYLREEQNITNSTSYSIFQSITPEEFKKTLKTVFVPKNSYTLMYRDYYFFPFELPVLSLFSILILLYFYFKLSKYDLQKKGLLYTHRDILFQRRVSSRFMGFLFFVITIFIVSVLWEWIKYYLSDFIFNDPYYLMTIDVPYSYIFTVLDPFLYVLLFIFIYKKLWKYYARIDVIDRAIVAVGNRVEVFNKDDIQKIDIVKWKPSYYSHTIGTSFRFWLALVSVKLSNNEIYYIRTTQAEHLKEDLEKWINK